MIARKLVVNNIRSYDYEEISFEEGTMLIHGDNGAGKSTILQSIFGGLYQTAMLDETSADVTLDKLVNRDSDKGSIRLTFEIGGDSYILTWVIAIREKDGERRGRSKKCTLKGENLANPVDGVKAVGGKVTDLIGMSPESFVNSVYVQQGDITRLIHADESDRQKIIDGLLGLDELDTYIERMKRARRELKSNRDDAKGRLSEKRDQYQGVATKESLKKELQETRSSRDTLDQKIDEIEDAEGELETKIDRMESRIDEYSELKEEKKRVKRQYDKAKQNHDSYTDDVDSLKAQQKIVRTELDETQQSIADHADDITGTFADESDVTNALSEARSNRENAKTGVTRIRDGRISTLENQKKAKSSELERTEHSIAEMEQNLTSVREDIAELKQQKQQKETEMTDAEAQLEEIRTDIEALCSTLDIPLRASRQDLVTEHIPKARDEGFENVTSLYSDLGRERLRLDQYEELTETGECPVCGVEHDDVSFVDEHTESALASVQRLEKMTTDIEEEQDVVDKLANRVQELGDKQSEVDRKQQTVSQLQTQITNKRERQSKVEDKLAELRDTVETVEDRIDELSSSLDEAEDELEARQRKLNKATDRVEELKTLRDRYQREHNLKEKVEDVQQEIEHTREMREQVQQRMDEKERKLNRIRDELDDIEVQEYRDRQKKFTEALEDLAADKKKNESKLESLREREAELEQQLGHVRSIVKRINQLEAKVQKADQQVTEATEALKSYETVKKRLRKENLDLLNRYANDVFSAFYRNQTYQQLRISEDYSITLLTNDGTEIEPELSSGGEGTIVNLSIRAGVYRLLTERNGSGDTLPPFILDEPTTYLDDAHISQLQSVIDTITEWNVPQVFVVSHDEQLIQNAETAYHVEKDPATERSTVTSQ